ncbi:hypothetical protein SLH49_01895 [Cognatiyoonia sp. IB215446]|uniref:hypothetical protein n=1 Tax=Cognatiyoonia sp. IB215446 TaxID=3097355 RepID=UPI002A0CB34F|nr:hypothetical protein [Cognatiyoonia sp. IB215446]MDX8346726.1 hypothetical protein [Cognatiyoonia sp. IB215446]
MKANKHLFLSVSDAVADLWKPEGFVEHPVYPTGWEAANQAYQKSLICTDLAPHIDQLEMSFFPKDRAFRFAITRSENVFGINDLVDLPAVVGDWTDMWLHQPFTEYQLCGGTRWDLLLGRQPFRLRRHDLQDVDKAGEKIVRAFAKDASYLFGALRGDYQGRRVLVRAYDMRR